MGEITPEFKHIVKIWWAYTWRQWALTFVVGLIVAFFVSILGGVLGFSYSSLDQFIGRVFLLIGFIASLIVLPSIFSVRWQGFRIALIPVEKPKLAESSQASDGK
jgi:hypothetical protein